MAELSKIKFNGTEYDLKDAVAREAIENLPDTSTFMVKGTDYVTAGKKTGTPVGTRATAEGYNTTAGGVNSHAEGSNTYAAGENSHAEGLDSWASGSNAHAEGTGTLASFDSQHTFGKYNIEDENKGNDHTKTGTFIEIVGNGTASNARSNARTLDWLGNEVLAGKLTIGADPTENMDVVTKQYVDRAIGGINSFDVSVVSTLPATGNAYTIYFVPQTSPSTAHDEYMYINNSWELIGSTQIDLSNYVQSNDLATVATSGSYNDLSNKPTIPTNVSAFTNDADYTTLTDVEDFLLDSQSGIERIHYEYVSELPDLEDSSYVWPIDTTIYIIEGDGWYKLNDAGDNWDKIHTGYSNYITTTDLTQETPESNTIYYNTENNNTYIYDGTDWKQIGYIPPPELNRDVRNYTITYSNNSYILSSTAPLNFLGTVTTVLTYDGEKYYFNSKSGTSYKFTTLLDSNKNYKEFTLNIPTSPLGTVRVTSFDTYSAASTITNALASGTLIATINGTNIYAPAYTDADGVSY